MAATMKLHWSPKSPYVRKVMICAHELGMLPKLELVRSVAAMLKPNEALMADKPLSKIPTLVREDGRALFDSVVICEYLNEQAKGTLFPPQGEARWQALLEAFELKTRACLELLDGEAEALASAPFSIGQVTIGCALGYLDYRFESLGWRGAAPRLAAWFAALQARPSFQSTEPIDG